MHFKLFEADYDFSDVVSKSELEACFFYEFARESRAAICEIDSARKQMRARKSGKVSFGSHVQNLIQSHILMSLSLTSGFPQTSWRNLSDKDRKCLVKMTVSLPHVSRYALTWHNPPLLFALNELGTTTLDMWKQKIQEGRRRLPDNEPIKFGFFAVNLKYGHPILMEEFRKYLMHFEGKPMLETPPSEKKAVNAKPHGRKSIHDALNALGAMRLRYYCATFSEAKVKMSVLKNKPHRIFYARRDSLNRACDSALRHFKKLFGWLVPYEKPIHFTEGWRRTPK